MTDKIPTYGGCGACEICGEIDPCITCSGITAESILSISDQSAEKEISDYDLSDKKAYDKVLKLWKKKIHRFF